MYIDPMQALVLALFCASLLALLTLAAFFADGYATRLWWTLVDRVALNALLWAHRVINNAAWRHKRAGTRPGEASMRFYTALVALSDAAVAILAQASRHLPERECH